MTRIKLKEARREAGLSQTQFAKELEVNRITVIGWEKGTQEPYPIHIPKIRAILNNTDPHLFDDTDVETQESQPLTCVPTRDILNSSDSHLDIPESEEGTNMDKGRRNLNNTIAAGIIAAATPIALVNNPPIITGFIIEPAVYLSQARLAIDTAWRELNTGNFPEVERILNAHISSLTRFAYTISPFQEQAAAFALEAKILQVLLANRDMQFGQRELCCTEAVQFGALSGDPNLLALALFWYGDTFTYCYHRPQRAIPLLNDALKNVSNVDGNSLTGMLIYGDLSVAHAQNRDESSALNCIEASYSVMPSNPMLDNRLYRIGPAELDQAVGKTYLELAEYLPDRYAQKAYDALEQSTNKQAISTDYLVQALTRKADAARVMGELRLFVDNLGETLPHLESKRRIVDAIAVVERVPNKWKSEDKVQRLQKDLNNLHKSLVVV